MFWVISQADQNSASESRQNFRFKISKSVRQVRSELPRAVRNTKSWNTEIWGKKTWKRMTTKAPWLYLTHHQVSWKSGRKLKSKNYRNVFLCWGQHGITSLFIVCEVMQEVEGWGRRTRAVYLVHCLHVLRATGPLSSRSDLFTCWWWRACGVGAGCPWSIITTAPTTHHLWLLNSPQPALLSQYGASTVRFPLCSVHCALCASPPVVCTAFLSALMAPAMQSDQRSEAQTPAKTT